MHFVFVACNKNKKLYRNDPSFIYRCENLAFGLEALGHTVELVHLSSFSLKNHTDVVLFHRPSYSLKLLVTVLYVKHKSVLPIFDVDDLIFDPVYAEDSPAVKNKILSLQKVERKFKKNLKALRLFSHFSVSTEPLAEHIRRLIPNSKIIQLPNAVHHTWKSFKKDTVDTKIKKLAYFPGTRSHDKDFDSIAKRLSHFLKNHSEVTLYITGPLNFDLDVPADQIVYSEKVPFSEHWRNYQNIWVNLAPLEKNPFSECKSALKIIEAGYWDVPTVSIANADTKRFADAGAVIVKDETEWVSKLEMLLDDTTYLKTTKNLQNKIVELADVEKCAQLFIDYIVKQKTTYLYPLFPKKIAKYRRKKGLYNCETLLYYRRAWQKNKRPKDFIDYCMFRRDLGYILSKNRANFIISILNKLGKRDKKYALSLLKDVSLEQTSHLDGFKESRGWLRIIHEKQEEWRRYFKEVLVDNKKRGICIVGNATTLNSATLGNKIDQQGLVIRFNRCWNGVKGDKNTGTDLDIWVSAPDFRGTTQKSADFVIMSGPDMLYREAGWDRFNEYIDSGGNLLTVPLNIWKELVFTLHAPPTAGVLILCWFKEMLGSWDGISTAGFDLAVPTGAYHHADAKHLPGKRHNWEKEKVLLQQWKEEGLRFLV